MPLNSVPGLGRATTRKWAIDCIAYEGKDILAGNTAEVLGKFWKSFNTEYGNIFALRWSNSEPY